mmetsp:Transcript_34825/g.81320  ORF Transcript_34825/g.81320 Transcript_34825/m.81320 type:complete len:113 (+) Transcript_34825:61-399(+)
MQSMVQAEEARPVAVMRELSVLLRPELRNRRSARHIEAFEAEGFGGSAGGDGLKLMGTTEPPNADSSKRGGPSAPMPPAPQRCWALGKELPCLPATPWLPDLSVILLPEPLA